MPNLGERKLDLSSVKNRKQAAGSKPKQTARPSPAPPPKKPRASANSLMNTNTRGHQKDGDDDDEDGPEDEDEDDIISESIKDRNEGNNKLIFIIGCVVVAIVVIVAFILFSGRNKQNPGDIQPPTQSATDPNEQQPATPPEIGNDPSVGTQDFTQNTQNTSTSPMTDPENFTKDIYGLTTRVDYTVAKIQEAADFVSYTKHRGTWGGGLELYYLDATYKGYTYKVQVPFKYYKELDETGIVPVRMEVLRIQPDTGGDNYLTIVSYMCLDEETLKTVLKSQSK